MRVYANVCQACGKKKPCGCPKPSFPAGALVDTGTGRTVHPVVLWFDTETGEWEGVRLALNGAQMIDSEGRPLLVRGKAKGTLQLVPLKDAADLLKGRPVPPKVVAKADDVLPAEAKEAGLLDYKRVFLTVGDWRGDSRKITESKWDEFLADNDFLDYLVLRRRPVPTH